MTSGKPSLRVMATPRLKIMGFSLRTCSISPLNSCSEMIRPTQRQAFRGNVRRLPFDDHCNYPRDYVSICIVKWPLVSKNVPERLRLLCYHFVQVSMPTASDCYNSIQSRHCFGSTMPLMTWLPATFNPSLNRAHMLHSVILIAWLLSVPNWKGFCSSRSRNVSRPSPPSMVE